MSKYNSLSIFNFEKQFQLDFFIAAVPGNVKAKFCKTKHS